MNMFGVTVSVCLLLTAGQISASHVTETLGDLTFQCEGGWSIYNGNCFKPIDVPLTYEDAMEACILEGGFVYYATNEIEYFDYTASVLPKKIWFGLTKNDKSQWEMGGGEVPLSMIPGWANLQPDEGDWNHTAVCKNGVEIVDGKMKLPVVCKRRACLDGYMSCDLSTKCLNQNRKCDGVPDCLDGSDENDCSNTCRVYKQLTSTDSVTTGIFADNMNCMTIIKAPPGKRIRLYIPLMNLEQNAVFLQVLSGAPVVRTVIQLGDIQVPIGSRVIDTLTGTILPTYMFSDNNYMIVRTYANDVSASAGPYSLGVTTEIPNLPSTGTVQSLTAAGTWTGQTLPFSSEKYGPLGLELIYEITAPEGQLITYYLDVVAHAGMEIEDVEFKIIVGEDDDILYMNYYTTQNNKLRLTSTMVPENGEVTLNYRTGCGMNIDRSNGVIHSPPGPIPNNLKCTWNLTGGRDVSRGMALKFNMLNPQSDPRNKNITGVIMSMDKLEVYIDDSPTPTPQALMQYDDKVENIIHAPNGKFRIDFTSDQALQANAFEIGFGTDCVALKLSPKTIMSTNMSYFMEDVELSCPVGYKFHLEHFAADDNVMLRCEEGWTVNRRGPGPIPECRIVHCGTPTKIENGQIKSATGVTYNSSATYQCNPGFHMNGGENATCDKSGDWINVPTCTSSQCSALSVNYLSKGNWSIVAGNNFTGNTSDFDTVVKFYCNPGYELIGPVLTHCTAAGWTHDVQNVMPKCTKLRCQLPQIHDSNASLGMTDPPVLYEQMYNVACNQGYKFDSGDNGTVVLTCQANQTFDKRLRCIDIDECVEGSNNCNATSTVCKNTNGSFVCECKAGYKRISSDSCTDILECADQNGGCSDTCVEDPGSYHCTCPLGFKLYTGNGFNGFTLPPSETGMMRGDTYHINHTCVPVPCPQLQQVPNGMYLNLSNSLGGFHYLDNVTLQCMDGYQIQGGTVAAGNKNVILQCLNNGTWNQLYNCTARQCSVPAVPTYGMLDKTTLNFGEVLTLTCNMTNTAKVTRTARCIYENNSVHLQGEDMTKCPEVDCGNADSVMPANGAYDGSRPNTTTYFPATSKFTFTCKPGFDISGSSNDTVSNTTVRCKENGRWNFGTLSCAGKMCKDPGTPGDARQIINGYEIGSVLSYTCNRAGFSVTAGPVNYTCNYNQTSNTADWSNNLATSLPECKDTTKPTFTGDCGKTYSLDKMQSVSFTPGSPADNFAIGTFSRSSFIRTNDVITAGTSVMYTATDFNSNSATCNVTFTVIDRDTRPSLQCPDYVSILVAPNLVTVKYTLEGAAVQTVPYPVLDTYNSSSYIVVSGGNLTVTPSTLSIQSSKIGTGQTVSAVAVGQYANSTCTFMVNFEANGCYQEQLFSDNNAVRTCANSTGLLCSSTCKSGYLYKDGTNTKTFTCTGTGSWNYSNTAPSDRYCLQTTNPEYEVLVDVNYNFGYLSSKCGTEFVTAMNNNVQNIASRLAGTCGMNWVVTVVSATTTDSFTVFKTRFKLTLLTTSATIASRQTCVNNLPSRPADFDIPGQQLTCLSVSYSLTAQSPSVNSSEVTCAQKTTRKINSSAVGGEICVSIGPAEFYDSVSNLVISCPEGLYQDGLAQTSCKTCAGGTYPNADKTGCQATCPAGFKSATGFYPCTPCQVDQYSVNKTTCAACSGGSSTVMKEGAINQGFCYAPCPAGTYSMTGYSNIACTPCPLNFYQNSTGQKMCSECAMDKRTSQTGSTHVNNCTAINDSCDAAYCNNHGICSFAYHRRVCTCNPGYYGDQCQNMYHICDGNPCTNGATCNRGATYTDYTCNCRTDLDNCSMSVVNDTLIAKSSVPTLGDSVPVNSVDECKNLCLNNPSCKEAFFIAAASLRFCNLYNSTLTADQLQQKTVSDEQHLRKSCLYAFSGNKCEKDTADNCNTAGCHPNSRCVDMINNFTCVCPSGGGYTGRKCDVTSQPCNPDPCVNGSCTPYGNVRYECNCNAGYTGIKCDQEINECTARPDVCLYGGKCVDLVNGYRCECKDGFTGTRCEQPPNYCSQSSCRGNNICYNSIDRRERVCVCDGDLYTPKYRCAMNMRINESNANGASNSIDVALYLTSEQCRDRCQDTVDCSVATYSNETGVGYVCALYNSSYVAKASTGSVAYHKDCNDRPVEAYACDRTANPCDMIDCNNGTCQNTSDTLNAVCSCLPGFTGSQCQHSIDDCVGITCLNGGTCQDRHLNFTCACATGFEGRNCETNTNDCPGACNTTYGTCEDRTGDYFCRCKPGYTGRNCDTEINECASYPCKHGGNCTDQVNDYSCTCPAGWTGKQCDNRTDNCVGKRTCLNGGECYSLETTSFCRCQGGALGENCGNATLVCDTLSHIDLCVNNGSCVNGGGSATCRCPINYDTERCYFEPDVLDRSGGNVYTLQQYQDTSPVVTIDFCRKLCLQKQECDGVAFTVISSLRFCLFYKATEINVVFQQGSTFARRVCPTDYNGKTCDQVKDWCAVEPCLNGGTCLPQGPVGYKCQCKPGFSGVNCQTAADPCASNPCRGKATCQSTVTEYICQCQQGKEWTGSVCRDTTNDYTLLVNSYEGQDVPSLQTSFRLNTTSFSIMMRVKVHDVNQDNPIATLFSVIATPDLKPKVDLIDNDYDFIISVNKDAYVAKIRGGAWTQHPLDDNFGGNLHDGEWHHLGIAVNSSGYMTVTIDPLSSEPVSLGKSLSLASNGQIFLGYGYIAEFQNVTIWDKYLTTNQIVQAYVNQLQTSWTPVQGFWNYRLPASSARMTQKLNRTLKASTVLKAPMMDCDKAEDVHYPTKDRLTQLENITEVIQTYENITSDLPSSVQKQHSLPSTLTWGYYPGIIIAKDMTTMNYAECRLSLYIRRNDVCPAVVTDATVSLTNCTAPALGYCDINCTGTGTALAAPTPNYIICGSLGVYDYRTPMDNFIMPSCTVTSNPVYVYSVSMQYQFSINCGSVNVGVNKQKLKDAVTTTFKTSLYSKWQTFCDDVNCSNLVVQDPVCVSTTARRRKRADHILCSETSADCLKRVMLSFYLTLKTKTATAVGGATVPVEDALKIIVQLEQDISVHLDNIAGAALVLDSPAFTMVTQCPVNSGRSLMMVNGATKCVPCSKGWYYNSTTMQCVICGRGTYQDLEGSTSCKSCPQNTTTAQKGARASTECKATCSLGRYFDETAMVCAVCPRHYYQNETGKNFCYPCKIGFKTVANGSVNANDCKEDCPAGKYRRPDNGSCENCRQGTWRSLAYDDCQPCPANKTTYLDRVNDSEMDCLIDICKLGEYFNDTEKVCKQCDLGTYQDTLYQLSCKMCPGNKTTRYKGSNSTNDCEFYCPRGYEQKSKTIEVCDMCQRGFYKDNNGLSKFDSCVQCTSPNTTEAMGSITSANCSIPICTKGQYIHATTRACTNCPQDQYSDVVLPNSATVCQNCTGGCSVCGELYGTMQPGSNSSQCRRYCEPGKQLNGDLCEMCPRGYYKDNVGNTRFDSCVKCPNASTIAKTTDFEGSTSSGNCSIAVCPAGTTTNNTGCSDCPVDTYQSMVNPMSTDKCVPCPLRNGMTTGTSKTRAVNENECQAYCPAGSFYTGVVTNYSQCQPCARGQYRDNAGSNRFLTSCKTCPSGYTTENTASTSADNCTIPICMAGQRLVSKVCTNCSLDTYSEVSIPNSSVMCIACNATYGAYYGTELTGANNKALCKPICAAGEEYINGSGCSKCAVGYFKEGSDRFGTCKSCQSVKPGYVTTSVGATSGTQCTLRDCPAGTFINGSSCTPCPVGKYQNESRQSNCRDCGVNLSTDGPGKTSFSDCQVNCGPGLQGNVNCILCPAGQYKNSSGFASCMDCPLNYDSNVARTECNVVKCSYGYEYKNTNNVESCVMCAQGSFKNTTGNTACIQCPDGKTTNGTGQRICDQPFCVSGEFLSGAGCIGCPVGTYKGTPGNQACTNCPLGYTTSSTGSKLQTECDTVVCPAGQYREPSQKSLCSRCPLSTYQSESGKTSCFNCTTGKITLQDGQTDITSCVPECKKGEEYNATSKECFLCPMRYYKDTVGNTASCARCPANKTTGGIGSTDVANCSQNVCPPGTSFSVENLTIKCTTCPVGTYNNQEMLSSCQSCGDTKTTQETGTVNNASCIAKCPRGYGYQTQKHDCFICPRGQYNAQQGLNPNTCKLCPSGKTNTQAGSDNCAFVDSPRVEERVDLMVTVVYNIAIDNCLSVDGINLIVAKILDLLKSAFTALRTSRYNTEKTFCRGSCDNLVQENLNSMPRCRQLTSTKRAISHVIELDIVFKNISLFVADQLDNNNLISSIEVISRLLELRKMQLTDETLEVIYSGYANISTTDVCNMGEYLNGTTCFQCPAGQYGSNMLTCSPCAVNTYQDNPGQSACKPCPTNTYTNGTTGSTSCLFICQAGSEYNSSTKSCIGCAMGYYKAVASNDMSCTACPAGFTTVGGSKTAASDCSQRLCVEGEYYHQNGSIISCFLCDIGFYNPNKMASQCTACPSSKTTLETGRTKSTDCVAYCQPGQGLNYSTDECQSCPIGQYNDRTGSNPNLCKACKDGTTNNQTGQTSCPYTIQVPEEPKRVSISIAVTYAVTISNCGDQNAISTVILQIQVQVRTVLASKRNSRYNQLKSFCNEGCTNVVVQLAATSPCTTRVQREATHDLNLNVILNNSTETTVDTGNKTQPEELYTANVVQGILSDRTAFTTPQGYTLDGSKVPVVSPMCPAGQKPSGSSCVLCGTGTYGTDVGVCQPCGQDTYQNELGQKVCKDCPELTFYTGTGATAVTACLSYCAFNTTFCSLRGTCTPTGRRTATCACNDGYLGTYCEQKKDPEDTSNLPVILGAAIGGGGGLLVLILIVVGVYRYLSDKDMKQHKKRLRESDMYRNDAFEDGLYDNYGYNGSQPRPVAPYPAVGYPALGYRPDTSFEEGSTANPYRMRPSVHGDEMEEETRFVWKA